MSIAAIMGAVKAQLEADAGVVGLSTAVKRQWLDGLPDVDLPLMQVAFGGDRVVDLYTAAPRVENRLLSLRVAFRKTRGLGETLEDDLFAAAEIIRQAIMSDETLDGNANETYYNSTQEPVITAEGDIPLGEIVVEFDVHYQVETFAFTPPDDLDSITGGIDVDDDATSEADYEASYGG